MQTLSGNQASAASKFPAAEERRDSQAIDPLSHVRLRTPGHSVGIVLRHSVAYPQQNEYAELAASEEALRSR